ncbi:MAG TPA: AI-2E family transporter [Terriglobales bacterium]|jgi:predicted PurR-regulated permease PerM|nr:AI-2E family transporter [Terriglobales bacterium]
MALIDSRTTRILFTVLVFAVGFAFLYVARRTLIAFLFAVFFAYLVDPAVSRVEKFARSRAAAITVIYLLIVLLLGTLFFFIGPRIGHEVQKLTESMPSLVERINSGQIVQDIGIEHGLTKNTRDQLSAFLKAHTGDLLKVAQRVGLRVAEAAQESWILVLIPILAGFFLKDGRVFSQVALSFVHSKPQREFLQGVINDMNLMLAQFIRAQLTLAALSWLAYASFLGLIMHVPYALMLGTAGGILEFIPVVGPLVASFLIIGVALLNGYEYWLIVGIFLIIWRLVQDYVVSPRIMGKSMELHPLAAIFGVLAGAEIAGVLGVYLSIPVMASLRIVWRRWRMYAEKKRFGPLNEYSFLSESSPRP